jgi:hypothetical protein
MAEHNYFTHQPLGRNEIRLLSFSNPQIKGTGVALTITSASARAGKTPPYEAISYTWGDKRDRVEITINNSTCKVTRSLYNILLFLQRTLAPNTLLWTDALCIDQTNDREKASQVGMMGPIYYFAALVRIFPCTDFVDLNLDVEEVINLNKRIPTRPPDRLVTPAMLVSHDIPSVSDDFWHQLRQVLLLPWFYRVWTIQEAVLARNLVLHCGNSIIHWEDLADLLAKLKAWSILQFIPNQAILEPCKGKRSHDGATRVLIIQKQHKKYLQSLVAQMLEIRHSLCSNPIDRVYGILWMVEEDVRAMITPDYTQETQENYWLVYQKLCHHALSIRPYLDILPMACTEQRHPNLPSWCSNLESPLDCYLFPGCAGGQQRPECGPHIASSRDGRRITLEGYYIYSITSVLEDCFQDCFAPEKHMICSRSNLQWLKSCFSFAQVHGVLHEELLRVLVADSIRSESGGDATELELYSLNSKLV